MKGVPLFFTLTGDFVLGLIDYDNQVKICAICIHCHSYKMEIDVNSSKRGPPQESSILLRCTTHRDTLKTSNYIDYIFSI